jgi:PglZ domain
MEPVANSSVVEGELRRALNSSRSVPGNSVLLLRAAPEWRGDTTFTMDVDAGQVTVTVAKCPTVLAVLAAIGTSRDDGGYLVVLTPCETREVGESVLARAMQPEIKPVNRWDLVQDAFGARRLDPALTRSENRWVAEALLDAQPAGGWRRLAGPVLTRATALNRLAATRLGIRDADDSAVDAAALLEWTTDASAVASFRQLRDAERDGLVDWLAQSVGPVADVVFAMDAPGKVPDAVPFGLAIAALYERADGPAAQAHGDALVARVRATERYLGGRSLEVRVLQAFGVAAESLVVRWTDNGHAPQAAALCERAESILAQLADGQPGNLGLVGSSRVLEAGLDARLAALAGALADALGDTALAPQAATLARVQDALRLVGEHTRKRDRGDEISAAQAAVRLVRWLAAPDEPMATLHDAATSMLRSWAWADRALTAISRADTSRVPRLAEAYANLWDRARARRARLDQAFARKLATWTEGSSATDGLLLVENLMDRIARPIAPQRPPVVVVLDGMTAAIGCELAEELTGRGGWLEAGRRPDGREPALATIPSVTSISRTSLLTGGLRVGGQAEERAGFAAFWGRRKSRLFHKADLTPGPGQALAAEVRDAIADPETVVGVVLNVIDDTLDKSKPGGPAHWTVETVTYLRPVLDEARRGGRPVILTADHGHVLEWGHSLDGGQSASSARSDSARYRIGEPAAGEIVIRGPRVLTAGAAVVAAVDETIRYTPRKAGYHGGASPAEVVIPAITLLPSESLLPPDWFAYDAAGHAPAWWDPPASTGHALPAANASSTRGGAAARGAGPRRSGRPTPDDNGALFGVAEAAGLAPAASGAERATTHGGASAGATSLGVRVIASPRMAVQRQFLRRAPDDASIAVLIDGLAQSGGRLTITEAAGIAGESPVRMSGYLAQVTRLLNVDGYPVLATTDGGRTVELNVPLLRQQFLGD